MFVTCVLIQNVNWKSCAGLWVNTGIYPCWCRRLIPHIGLQTHLTLRYNNWRNSFRSCRGEAALTLSFISIRTINSLKMKMEQKSRATDQERILSIEETNQLENSNRFREGETKLFIPNGIEAAVYNFGFCCLLQIRGYKNWFLMEQSDLR